MSIFSTWNDGWLKRVSAGIAVCTGAACFAPQISAQEAALVNVSTRGVAGTGENVMIAGFIVEGTTSRKVAIRVLGPSLVKYGIQGVLDDPTITLNASGTDLATNDDWQTDTVSAAALRAANLAPGSDREPALVRTLNPGSYTVLVGGKGAGTGVTLVEINDLDAKSTSSTSRVVNLSTRGRVESGEKVMIMGFIIGGTSSRTVLLTTMAGSLAELGVSSVLADPKMEIFKDGQKIAESDDWIDSPDFNTIARTGASPRDPLESAVWLNLPPGGYTAVISGVKVAQGVALPALYEIRGLRAFRFSPVNLSGRTAKLAISSGAAPEQVDFVFNGTSAATVNAGASGTYTYSTSDDFRGTITVEASGYTLTGKLQFYRDKMGVFDGTLRKPGGSAVTAGGIFILN